MMSSVTVNVIQEDIVCKTEPEDLVIDDPLNNSTVVKKTSLSSSKNKTDPHIRQRIKELVKKSTICTPAKTVHACGICAKIYYNKGQLKQHMKSHKEKLIQRYTCHQCPKTFSAAWMLKKHIYIHLNGGEMYEKRYFCEYCGKGFYSSSNLIVHVRMHTGEKPFPCTKCEKSFVDGSTRRRHIKTVHCEKKEFVCNICGKEFSQKGHLKGHILTHSDYKPYLCTLCPKKYSDPYMLKRHVRYHTKRKYNKQTDMFGKVNNYKDQAISSDVKTNVLQGNNNIVTHCAISELVSSNGQSLNKEINIQNEDRCTSPEILRVQQKTDSLLHQNTDDSAISLNLLVNDAHNTTSNSAPGAHCSTDVNQLQFRTKLSDYMFSSSNDLQQSYCTTNSNSFPALYSQVGNDSSNENEQLAKTQDSYDNTYNATYNIDIAKHQNDALLKDLSDSDQKVEIRYNNWNDTFESGCSSTEEAEDNTETKFSFNEQNSDPRHIDPEYVVTCNDLSADIYNDDIITTIKTEPKDQNELLPDQNSFIKKSVVYAHNNSNIKEKSFLGSSCNEKIECNVDKCVDKDLKLSNYDSNNIHVSDNNLSSLKEKVIVQQDRFENNTNNKVLGVIKIKPTSVRHAKTIHACSECNKTCSTKYQLDVHMRCHTGIKPNICEICNKGFYDKSTLLRHMVIHSGIKNFCCKECNKSFTQSSHLQSHMSVHQTDRPFMCEQCPLTFKNVRNLVRHKGRVHALVKQIFPCDKCEKTFSCIGSLKKHLPKHSIDSAIFICDQCKKAFVNEYDLKKHFQTHSSEQPFECKVCKKSYKYKRDLDQHMLMHKELRPFVCDICGKGFTQRRYYTDHCLLHVDKDDVNLSEEIKDQLKQREEKATKRLSECNICGKVFRDKQVLKVHMRKHTGERPYKCELCDKAFTSSHRLKVHGWLHTGENPHQCPTCGKGFKQTTLLSAHMKKYEHDMAHKCMHCENYFISQRALEIHMLKHSSEGVSNSN